MYAKKTSPWVWAVPCILVLLLMVAAVVFFTQFVLVGTKVYPKKTEHLDLRGEDFGVSQFRQLQEKLPQCEILWDVPFQGQTFPSDTTTLTVTSLSAEDVAALAFFPELTTVDASGCTDYEQLLSLEALRPEVAVLYEITIGGAAVDRDVKALTLKGIDPEELPKLDCLKALEKITVTGGETGLLQLQEYCHQRGLGFAIVIGGETVPETARELTVKGITDEELLLLPLLPELKTLVLEDPKATAEHVLSLNAGYPELKVSWSFTLGDTTLSSGSKDLDLSKAKLTSLEDLEKALSYFPEVESVFLGIQDGLKNEDVAQFRERNRQNYKVVWEVRFGDKRSARTDITYFKPGHDWIGGPSFGDAISYNLRYCEDLICVDVGHLGAVKHVDWLEGLVNLEYLILAHTDIRSLEGIQHCKKLKFLELDWTGIKDLTPLKGCTALEDLNIGMAWPDVTPLFEMPWLKNIYMIYGSGRDASRLSQALPDTHVVATGNATVGSGWRKLPNYFAMRDAMHAPYMEG